MTSTTLLCGKSTAGSSAAAASAAPIVTATATSKRFELRLIMTSIGRHARFGASAPALARACGLVDHCRQDVELAAAHLLAVREPVDLVGGDGVAAGTTADDVTGLVACIDRV